MDVIKSAKKGPKNVYLTIRISEREKKEFQKFCDDNDLNLSELIRAMMIDLMQKHKK